MTSIAGAAAREPALRVTLLRSLMGGVRRLIVVAVHTSADKQAFVLARHGPLCLDDCATTEAVAAITQGERLPGWLDAVRQDDLPGLHTLTVGTDRDRDAVIAGLTLPWSSGVLEGHITRIKTLKRQIFGRSGFALLRKRVSLYS
ncbi:hypothetical protein [Streptomyces sp. NPDC048295]|uniref:hypothetical protein n=1 Tax=Streptomyces sp. NPDC048295 TaxID=3154617 RepID=UPI003433B5E9